MLRRSGSLFFLSSCDSGGYALADRFGLGRQTSLDVGKCELDASKELNIGAVVVFLLH